MMVRDRNDWLRNRIPRAIDFADRDFGEGKPNRSEPRQKSAALVACGEFTLLACKQCTSSLILLLQMQSPAP
jgi:hypothetical protein